MKYGIGIDTGGTYTDAVIFDFEQRKILSAAKALTTKDDLSVGIKNALMSLNGELLRKAEIISLSTTLATNACVENKGGRSKLLYIDIDEKIIRKYGGESGLDIEQIYFMDEKAEEDIKRPDWDVFSAKSSKLFRDAEAMGIVELNAMNNGSVNEKKACEIIKRDYNFPVICGHEMSAELNSIKRGAGVLLNGRLISVLNVFLAAIKKALDELNIKAPVAIVRSDGSLMSEQFTGVRPVETILCGPAASVIGGFALSGEKQAVIVDMGGTTTDIALIRNGVPVRAEKGISIGGWRTFVKGLYVETLGLGGDSAIRYDSGGRLVLDTVRVMPLSVAASQWPEITDKLKELLEVKEKHSLFLHEFFALVKDIGSSDLNAFYTETEKEFCEALKKGPLIYTEAAAAIDKDPYNLNVSRLEKEGVVIRCGLTATDIMHLKGDFTKYTTEAAALGARFVANSTGMDAEGLCDRVYDEIKMKLYYNIVSVLLKESMPELHNNQPSAELDGLINHSWKLFKRGENDFKLNFATSSVLVGVGAPIHIFLPDVAKALGTTCVIPEHANVANAVGAVAGNVTASYTAQIHIHDNGYIAYGKAENFIFAELEDATAAAAKEAEKEAKAEAIRRGAAGNIAVSVSVEPLMVKTGYGTEFFLESKVTATAFGNLEI